MTKIRVREESSALDKLDFFILERLLDNAFVTFKDIARMAGTDQRTISNRFEGMRKQGIIQKATLDIDWTKVGLTVSAYIGSSTSLGEAHRQKLFDYIRKEPRVVEAYATIGSNEYFLKVLDVNLERLRSNVCNALEPLTVDLTTSVISGWIKPPDYSSLIRYISELNEPKRR